MRNQNNIKTQTLNHRKAIFKKGGSKDSVMEVDRGCLLCYWMEEETKGGTKCSKNKEVKEK